MESIATEMPWHDSEKWVIGDWYPLPFGFFARNQKEYIIEGYGVFELSKDGMPGDITPVDFKNGTQEVYIFSTALAICEAHNRRRMLL